MSVIFKGNGAEKKNQFVTRIFQSMRMMNCLPKPLEKKIFAPLVTYKQRKLKLKALTLIFP